MLMIAIGPIIHFFSLFGVCSTATAATVRSTIRRLREMRDV